MHERHSLRIYSLVTDYTSSQRHRHGQGANVDFSHSAGLSARDLSWCLGDRQERKESQFDTVFLVRCDSKRDFRFRESSGERGGDWLWIDPRDLRLDDYDVRDLCA